MRRLLPLWTSLFAVLLLLQSAGAGTACLHGLQGHGTPLCVATLPGDHPAPDTNDHAAAGGCPLCAPLPPAILPGPAAIAAAPAIHPAFIAAATPAWHAPLPSRPWPLQPRAPPPQA